MNTKDVRNIAVLGTGTMAPGIAQLFSLSGYNVTMWGRTDASLQRGFDQVRSNLRTYQENDLIEKGQDKIVLSRLKGVKKLEEAAEGADFVIESVAEDMSLKKQIFVRLDSICQKNAILATNTSGLGITEIASETSRPEKVLVTHFWNPPHLIPLVEIVRGEKTSEETIKVATDMMLRIGKTPVLVKKEVPGFIGNRLQFALLREALYIVEEGIASMEDVDTTVKMSFGRRLPATGPLESADLGGLDIFGAVSQYLMKDLCKSCEVSPLLADRMKKQELGVKSGKGLYNWSPELTAKMKKAREKLLIAFLKEDLISAPLRAK